MADKAQAGSLQGRRYVGTAETVGFIMFDAATDVAVKPNANEEWIDRILDISKGMQALVGPIMTAWDVVNDLFLAALIEKTRTRFGKFRPYLVLYPVYGLPMALLVCLLPYFFWQTGNTFMPKIIAWAAVSMFNELTDTIGQIARMGMVANITPDPQERLSLMTKAKLMSFGSSLPKQIFGVLRDIISRNTMKTALQVNINMRTLFMVMGIITMIISSGLSLYYALVSKERVVSSETEKEKPPTIRESLRALKNNRPLFMVMLSLILDGFNIKDQLGTYTNSILNFTNFGLVSGIPGGFISTPSYFYLKKLREHFSTKTLWIASQVISKPVIIAAYFFGMIRTKKSVNGINRMFMQLWPMLGAFCLEDMVLMTLYSARRVIPDEIRNECIDYGEWKNGFRSEAMVGVLRGIPGKIANIFGKSITNLIMEIIGFKTGEGYLQQDEKTAIGVFAMATIIPTLTGFIAVIPKFFYNINQKDREIMYAELAERRAATMAVIGEAREGGKAAG